MNSQVIFSMMAFVDFLLLGFLHPALGLWLHYPDGVSSLLLSPTFHDVWKNQYESLLGPIDTTNITFDLYTRYNLDQPYVLVTGDKQNFNDALKNCSWPTVVIIHGWTGAASNSQIQALRAAYLNTGDYHVIVVNWYPLSTKPYNIAVQIARMVAKLLGELLEFISTMHQISVSSFHIIGHKLGAQIAGLTSQYMSNPVGRITGLDPASLYFEYPNFVDTTDRLDRSDAVFVDVVHTCKGLVDVSRSIGHTDFYPNGAVAPQPKCNADDLSCCHAKSLDFWIDSVNYPNELIGVKCDSWDNYKNGKCTGNPTAIMGDQNSCVPEGDYYLVTGSTSPYDKC